MRKIIITVSILLNVVLIGVLGFMIHERKEVSGITSSTYEHCIDGEKVRINVITYEDGSQKVEYVSPDDLVSALKY